MKAAGLVRLVGGEVRRSGGALVTASVGILAGTAALVFFLALGLAVRGVLLGQVFPIDRVEFEPVAKPEPGLLSVLLGGGRTPPGIDPASVDRLAHFPGVAATFPKLRFAFPSGAFGGAELLGREVGTHEMIGDGIDPALVRPDEVKGPFRFVDPLEKAGAACRDDAGCQAPQYCELPSDQPQGQCSDPVPVLVSPYLVELFNQGIARAHGLPAVGQSMLSRAQGGDLPVAARRVDDGAGEAGQAAQRAGAGGGHRGERDRPRGDRAARRRAPLEPRVRRRGGGRAVLERGGAGDTPG